MFADEIKLGDRIEISKKSNPNLKTYVSIVEENIGNNKICAYAPISYGKLIKLNTIEVYSMVFFTEKGMYRFDTKITGYSNKDGFGFMEITLINNGEKIQRRHYYRFNCIMRFKFEKLNEENEALSDDEFYKKMLFIDDGIIKDLSGGGIKFVSDIRLEEKDIIKMIISIGEKYIICSGEIVGKQNFSRAYYKYQYRVMFTDILDKNKELIIKYIFQQQRRLAKKRLGL